MAGFDLPFTGWFCVPADNFFAFLRALFAGLGTLLAMLGVVLAAFFGTKAACLGADAADFRGEWRVRAH